MNQEKHFNQFRSYLNSYSPITEDSFSKLVTLISFRTVEKGEYLLQVNQRARNMYFVCEGVLTSLFLTNDGGTHIKNFFVEGNLAGSTVSMMLFSPSDFAIQSLESGLIMEFDYKKYRELLFEQEDLKHFYIALLEKNWVIENEKRQIAFATQSATERYLIFLEKYPFLDQRIPQLHIASYLGITPTQLSRIRKDLKK
ncbi:MAG: CRP-like cAMP-binding protein [Urechidicola sp.]|jgi:CRP-like cAMP-binding protein